MRTGAADDPSDAAVVVERLDFAPEFEPYFIAKPPLPLFAEVYRGRGHDKSSWFSELSLGGDEYSLHLLPGVFVLADTRRDSYRSADGSIDSGSAHFLSRAVNSLYNAAFARAISSQQAGGAGSEGWSQLADEAARWKQAVARERAR